MQLNTSGIVNQIKSLNERELQCYRLISNQLNIILTKQTMVHARYKFLLESTIPDLCRLDDLISDNSENLPKVFNDVSYTLHEIIHRLSLFTMFPEKPDNLESQIACLLDANETLVKDSEMINDDNDLLKSINFGLIANIIAIEVHLKTLLVIIDREKIEHGWYNDNVDNQLNLISQEIAKAKSFQKEALNVVEVF